MAILSDGDNGGGFRDCTRAEFSRVDVLIMSNGGFGGIHDKLLAQLGLGRG